MSDQNASDPPGPLAGWYVDPSGQPGQRWWDGSEWTPRTQPDAQRPEKWSERVLREGAEQKAQKQAAKRERQGLSGTQAIRPANEAQVSSPVLPGLAAEGRTGTVVFDGDFVTIKRSGFVARATVGKGEKRIGLSSISAVQWKPAGGMANGFIQFTLGGGSEVRSRFGAQTHDAGLDENSVVFNKKQMAAFDALRHAIETAIANRHRPPEPSAPAPDLLSQVKQLGELRDAGLLSEEEFAARKAQLLDRL